MSSSTSGILSGKVALVTGAARGIGAAIATHLGKAGATVLVNYSKSEAPAKAVVRGIIAAGGKASVLKGDVSDSGHFAELFKTIDKDHGGKIDILVNNAGVYLTAPFPGVSVYAASKFAVAGLSRGLARDLAPRKITVNIVQPGPIDTDMNPADESKNPAAGFIKNMIPLGRYGTTDDVASAVTYLASPAAAFVTGAKLTVDGGVLA